MKTSKLLLLVCLLFALIVSPLRALDFTIGPVPQRPVPVEFNFTLAEVADALKAAISKKYPNADVEGVDLEIRWCGQRGNQPWDYVWLKNFPDNRDDTNFHFTVFSLPTVTVPKIPDSPYWANRLLFITNGSTLRATNICTW